MTEQEPTLRDLYLLMQDMNAALNLKIDQVHGIVRHTQREIAALRSQFNVLYDSYAVFRTEYLSEHPRGEAS